ncbi:MAG TPA: hypothetical protein VJ550_08565 [Geomonas sp.]|nr:hypothetical protein [Geomonas sp.]
MSDLNGIVTLVTEIGNLIVQLPNAFMAQLQGIAVGGNRIEHQALLQAQQMHVDLYLIDLLESAISDL